MKTHLSRSFLPFTLSVGLCLGWSLPCLGETVAQPAFLQGFIESWGDAVELERQGERQGVKNHLVPLGAMQKLRGVWAPRAMERVSGDLASYSWKVADGFTVHEVLAGLETALLQANASELSACDARACGSSSQWASRIFSERLLYGREAAQRYRCYSVPAVTGEYRVMVYASARTATRQYLHVQSVHMPKQAS